jgi:hypothetical protein
MDISTIIVIALILVLIIMISPSIIPDSIRSKLTQFTRIIPAVFWLVGTAIISGVFIVIFSIAIAIFYSAIFILSPFLKKETVPANETWVTTTRLFTIYQVLLSGQTCYSPKYENIGKFKHEPLIATKSITLRNQNICLHVNANVVDYGLVGSMRSNDYVMEFILTRFESLLKADNSITNNKDKILKELTLYMRDIYGTEISEIDYEILPDND